MVNNPTNCDCLLPQDTLRVWVIINSLGLILITIICHKYMQFWLWVCVRRGFLSIGPDMMSTSANVRRTLQNIQLWAQKSAYASCLTRSAIMNGPLAAQLISRCLIRLMIDGSLSRGDYLSERVQKSGTACVFAWTVSATFVNQFPAHSGLSMFDRLQTERLNSIYDCIKVFFICSRSEGVPDCSAVKDLFVVTLDGGWSRRIIELKGMKSVHPLELVDSWWGATALWLPDDWWRRWSIGSVWVSWAAAVW